MISTFTKYTETVEHLTESIFLLHPTGEIVYCNSCALDMFGYNSINEVTKKEAKDLTPEDFAHLFPKIISSEHLTNGEYLERVNSKKNKEEFPTWVKTSALNIRGIEYIETRVRYRDIEKEIIPTEKLKQAVEVLKCELTAERNRAWKISAKVSIDNFVIEQLEKLNYKLSKKDRCLVSLIYHSIDAKEYAKRMNISISSAYTARKRLRKRLDIPHEQTIHQFLHEKIN